jgi:hypothetical protein
MNTSSQDMGSLERDIITQDDVLETPTTEKPQPELIDYQCQRYPLWDIHRFVEQVLATDKPGFLIRTTENGKTNIIDLPLAWHFKLMRSYIERIPPDCKPSPLIALFMECCRELGLHSGFTQPSHCNEQGISEAERYNTLLALIRSKASTIKKYKKAKQYVSNYDMRMFKRLQKYINNLFLRYPKLLIIRLDLEYREDHAEFVTLAQARQDISRFISHRRWNKLFAHNVGFIIAREHGENGCGFHFHCILFFNGHKRHQDINIARAIGEQYWEGYITRLACEGQTSDTRGRYFNCNAKQDDYRYLGVGLISHADEVKRSNLSYALIYLTKDDQGLEGVAPRKTKTLTRGLLPRLSKAKNGRKRRAWGRGKKVKITRPVYAPTWEQLL